MRFVNRVLSIRSWIHTFLLKRATNVSVGKGTTVYYKSDISNFSKLGKVIIGHNCLIGRSWKGNHTGMPFYTMILNDGEDSNIIIGNNCRINGAYIHAQSSVVIGDNCLVASGVNIIDSNGHVVKSLNRTTGRDIPCPIIIGNNVWIGVNAIILKGTEIGDNCVVAAGAIVKGKYESNSIIYSPIAISNIIPGIEN